MPVNIIIKLRGGYVDEVLSDHAGHIYVHVLDYDDPYNSDRLEVEKVKPVALANESADEHIQRELVNYRPPESRLVRFIRRLFSRDKPAE